MILFSKKDFKYKKWAEALSELGYDSFACNQVTEAPYYILKNQILGNGVQAYVCRYLNDRKSLAKSVLMVMADFITIILCFLFGIKRYWIVHNVDKESQAFYPRFISIRRFMISKTANRIFVTDRLLEKYVRLLFKFRADRISHVTFGKYESGLIKRDSSQLEEGKLADKKGLKFDALTFDQLLRLIKNYRKEYDLIGFCGGKYLEKKIYFQKLAGLSSALEKSNVKCLMVVLSDIKITDNEKAFTHLSTDKNVLFVNSVINLNEHELAKCIDFYWSGYDDISIPFTLYTASTVKVPILCYPAGVLPMLIRQYQIGVVIKKDFSDLSEALEQITNKETFKFDEFTAKHTWRLAMENLTQQMDTGSK